MLSWVTGKPANPLEQWAPYFAELALCLIVALQHSPAQTNFARDLLPRAIYLRARSPNARGGEGVTRAPRVFLVINNYPPAIFGLMAPFGPDGHFAQN